MTKEKANITREEAINLLREGKSLRFEDDEENFYLIENEEEFYDNFDNEDCDLNAKINSIVNKGEKHKEFLLRIVDENPNSKLKLIYQYNNGDYDEFYVRYNKDQKMFFEVGNEYNYYSVEDLESYYFRGIFKI